MVTLKKRHLRRAKPEALVRFARWLGFQHIDGMSHRQLAKLVYWLITRHQMKALGRTLNGW